MTAFDQTAVEAEIRAEFDAYERALGENDLDTLSRFFWEDAAAVRLGPDGGLYGHDRIGAFRRARDVSDIEREVFEIRVVAHGPNWGTATCEFRRIGSGKRGAQSQVWKRFPEGWRIVSAHMSLQA